MLKQIVKDNNNNIMVVFFVLFCFWELVLLWVLCHREVERMRANTNQTERKREGREERKQGQDWCKKREGKERKERKW